MDKGVEMTYRHLHHQIIPQYGCQSTKAEYLEYVAWPAGSSISCSFQVTQLGLYLIQAAGQASATFIYRLVHCLYMQFGRFGGVFTI